MRLSIAPRQSKQVGLGIGYFLRAKFGLKFFDGRQAAFEFGGELHQMLELGDAHRRGGATKRVLNHKFLLRSAKNQADAGLVCGVLQEFVDGAEVEIHLPGVLGLEGTSFEDDHDEATKLQVIEE